MSNLVYNKPNDIKWESIKGRMVLSTLQGGKIAMDSTLLNLLERADGCELSKLLRDFRADGASPEAIRAGLACLAEAGLLRRSEEPTPDREETLKVSKTFRVCMVSVILVNFNSLQWLMECLPSLAKQTYQPLEVVLVDINSTDGSVEWVIGNYPATKILHLEKWQGLAHAINRALGVAGGEYFLILNLDVRLDEEAVREMVAVAQSDPDCAAVAAKLKFWWAPAFLNGLGNHVGVFTWGADNALGHLDLGQFDAWREVPSVCFAAAMIPCPAWERIGPPDEHFTLYYEDTEWSYRARLLGFTVRAAPKAVVYHALGSKVHRGEEAGLSAEKLHRVVYGRLRFALKIVAFPGLLRFLLTYSLEDILTIILALVRGNRRKVQAVWEAWLKLWRDMPELRKERRSLQGHRKRTDRELFAMQKGIPPPLIWNGLPELTWDLVVDHYLPLIRSGKTHPVFEFEGISTGERPRLLIVSNDLVDVKMAGPGMRYLEMARALSDDLHVTLAVPGETSLEVEGLHLASYQENRPDDLRALVANCDVALISPFILNKFPFFETAQVHLVLDLYDPFLFENLHYYVKETPTAQDALNRQAIELLNRAARVGDFFICGSERQRDLYIGMLVAAGRVTPQVFSRDKNLRNLIDVVGIGIPEREPHRHPVLRGVHPAFPADARIILWGGGIWDWLDPLILVEAWPEVVRRFPQARLVFLGTRHPNPLVPPHAMAERTIARAEATGEKDRTIFFFEWLPYEERQALLCEADIGVSLHSLHAETRYAIRTRVLDYIWASLPVLASDGDVTSEWVREGRLGRVIPPSNTSTLVAALCDMLGESRQVWGPAFDEVRKSLSWSRIVMPLREYCLKEIPEGEKGRKGEPSVAFEPAKAWRVRLGRARYILRTQGLRMLLHRTWRYLQWRLSQL